MSDDRHLVSRSRDLVGRAHELQAVGVVLEAREQCGVLLSGAPGIGKTRLPERR
jgi:MoxR-like ATPase